MKAAFVITFYTGALSTRVITCDSRHTCVLLCKIGTFTAGVITGDERGVNRDILFNYITLGAYSTGVITGNDGGVNM